MLKNLWQGQTVSFLAVTLHDLTPPTHQLSSLPDVIAENNRTFMHSIAALHNCYCDDSIVFGRVFASRNAPRRSRSRRVSQR